VVDFIDATIGYPTGIAANFSMEPGFDSEVASVGTLKHPAPNVGVSAQNTGWSAER
jgi:hypothetical protein